MRMLSAGVMIGVGAVEVWLGGPTFAALVILLTAGMVWEVARMTAPLRRENAIALGLIAGAALLLALISQVELAAAFLMAPALAVALTPRRDRRLAAGWTVAVMVAGYGLVSLRETGGTEALLWLILVVVMSDVMGYFVGRIVGGPKFWPSLSPKKTWSGTIAGWIGGAAVGAGFVMLGHASWWLILLSPLVALAGQMGDIAESWLKRRADVKDSSRLIPGHGGLLDRFDALTGSAVAVMALGLFLNLPLPQPMPFDTATGP